MNVTQRNNNRLVGFELMEMEKGRKPKSKGRGQWGVDLRTARDQSQQCSVPSSSPLKPRLSSPPRVPN
jgi:hypothetical protein